MSPDRPPLGTPEAPHGEPPLALSAHGQARREAMLESLLAAQSRVKRNRQTRSLVLAVCLAAAAVIPAVWFGGRVPRSNAVPKTAESVTPTAPPPAMWEGVEIVTNAGAASQIEQIDSGAPGIASVRTADLLPSIRSMAMSDDELLAALRESGRACALMRIAGGPARLLCPDELRGRGG
jgi:hypothetical protein